MRKTKLETGNSKLDTLRPRMAFFPIFVFRFSSFVFSALWRWLREVSGDDAYERYLTRAVSARVTLSEPDGRAEGSASLLSPAEFYRERLERKYSRPCRCC